MTTTPDTSSSILIVDDMEENLVALEAVLGSLTQKVVRARSGEEALKAMLREEFAVVLIDVLMPGMNGFETAANIKGLDQTKDVPIILLTGASVDPNYAYRGYTVGAADFLIKPFDPWLLRTKVNVFLELHRKNRQLTAQAEQLKRLLTTENRPGGETPAPQEPHATQASQPAQKSHAPEETPPEQPPVHPEPTDDHQPAEPPTAPHAPLPEAGDASRLAEVAGQLAEVELLLRESKASDQKALADRIAELEQAVGRLLVSGGT
ncbi:two-component system response regulator [Streptomyces inhibens]|uniref:response regulator n=1 Tax=Streptomyces inhibens TaxID=2293571 RepID=UPI0036915493